MKSFIAKMESLLKEAKASMGSSKPKLNKANPKPARHNNEKGVHTSQGTAQQGTSLAGLQARMETNQKGTPSEGKPSALGSAKESHKQKLKELKSMPKPKLTKDAPKPKDEESAQSKDLKNKKQLPPAGPEKAPEKNDQDKDGIEDQKEDHGPIDPSMDENKDGLVTHDEAEDASNDENQQEVAQEGEEEQIEGQDDIDETAADENPEMDGQDQGDGYTYLAGDGDSIGAKVGQAMLHDDVEGLHEVSNRINQGQGVFAEWLSGCGGEMISAGGDEFVARVPSSADLSSLESFRSDYANTVGATVTVGVGRSMSEAGKALIFGKLHGKDQVSNYDDSVDQYLHQIQGEDADPNSEEGKQKEHYVDSLYDDSQEGEQPEGSDPIEDGMSSPNEETQFEQDEDEAKLPFQKDGEEVDAEVPSEDEADMPMSDVSAGDSFEDVAQDNMQGGDGEYLKGQMMNVLDGFKKDKEFIEHLQTSAPEQYNEVIALLHQMIKVTKMMNGPQQEDQQDPNATPEGEPDEANMTPDEGQAPVAPKEVPPKPQP